MTMVTIIVVVLALVTVVAYMTRRRGRKAAAERALPPGSMGWPYVGETLQLYSQNPNEFFAGKQRKYGPVFKTHILGCPCVMVSSPEAAKFVLLTKSHLFKPTFPASKERMLGKQAIFFHQGPYHLKLRKLVLRAFSPDSIRAILPRVDSLARAWPNHHNHRDGEEPPIINTFQHMKTFAFDVALISIFGESMDQEEVWREDLKRCYYVVEKGYNSMPINLPGTLFHSAMKARNELAQILARILATRRAHPSPPATGLLASFMAHDEALTDDQIADNIIGVIFAARDTTATVLTWILKYLHDNPAVLEAVTEEQDSIMRNKSESEALTWADAKSMPVTSRVIQETLRVASVLSFTFREAVEDVEYDGFLIPKGWKVLPLFRNIHHSPDFFPEPEKFDPSRFKAGPPKPNTYIPFGNGTHSCPGNELAKLEMLVLLHHLTTKYRWNVVGSQNGIQYGPFALPENGLPITLIPRNTNPIE